MKKIILTSLAAILLATSAKAGGYVAGYATTKSDDNVDIFDSMTLDASVGYAFQNGFRAELDVFTANVYDGDENTDINFGGGIKLGYLKGLYDFKNNSKFTPYAGLGINTLTFSYKYNDSADSSLTTLPFLAELVVGVSMAVKSNISLDLQYNREFAYNWTRYAFGGNSASNSSSNGSNTFKLGIVYKF